MKCTELEHRVDIWHSSQAMVSFIPKTYSGYDDSTPRKPVASVFELFLFLTSFTGFPFLRYFNQSIEKTSYLSIICKRSAHSFVLVCILFLLAIPCTEYLLWAHVLHMKCPLAPNTRSAGLFGPELYPVLTLICTLIKHCTSKRMQMSRCFFMSIIDFFRHFIFVFRKSSSEESSILSARFCSLHFNWYMVGILRSSRHVS